MTVNQGFYFPDETYYERAAARLNTALEKGWITNEDKKIISRYLLEKDSVGIGPKRHLKLATTLVLLREYHPPYLECTTEDVLTAFSALKFAKIKRRRGEVVENKNLPRMKQNTISDKQKILKSFFLWVSENGINPNLDHLRLSKIKPARVDYNTVRDSDLLTEEELQAFFKACTTTRDKAMYHVMFEGALRVGEIGNLQFKDLELNDRYCKIITAEKTGIQRIIPLHSSQVYLSRWLNEYPKQNPSPEDFVFLNRRNSPISRTVIASQMTRIGERAGIKKKIHPHLFRHTRITMLSRSGLDEAKIKLLAWGNLSTEQMKTYNHLTPSDLEEALAEIDGIETPKKKKKSLLNPIQCPKCGTINPAGHKYCECCMKPLTKEGEEDLELLGRLLLEKLKVNPAALGEILK